jgi:hypothetical protein
MREDWRRFFNRSVPKGMALGGAAGEAGPDTGREGVFVTPQSLTSFPAATAVASALWGGLRTFEEVSFFESRWCGLIIALLFGAAIFLISVTDPQRAASKRENSIQLFTAIVNSFMLYTAMLGVSTMTSGS